MSEEGESFGSDDMAPVDNLLKNLGLPQTCSPEECRPNGLDERDFPEDLCGSVSVDSAIYDEGEE
jgi:hypothetical protein